MMKMTMEAFWLMIGVEFLLAGWATLATLRWRHWRTKWKRADAAARYYSALAQVPLMIFGSFGPEQVAPQQKPKPDGDDDKIIPFPGRKPDEPRPL